MITVSRDDLDQEAIRIAASSPAWRPIWSECSSTAVTFSKEDLDRIYWSLFPHKSTKADRLVKKLSEAV